MSIENVKKFYVSASEDAKLVEALKKISEEMQQKSLASDKLNELVSSKIIPLAKERGFDFTADELIAYSQEMIKGLSEEDLAAVSGGMSPRTAAIALAFTLGSSFVAAGVVNMMSNTPTQNQAIMSSSKQSESKKINKDSIPKLVRDESEESDAEAPAKDLSKDNQKALKDKKIVLPGRKFETPKARENVEKNKALREAAEESGETNSVQNEAKVADGEGKKEQDILTAEKGTSTPEVAHIEEVKTPKAAPASPVFATGTEESAVTHMDEIPVVSNAAGSEESAATHVDEPAIEYGNSGAEAEADAIDLTNTTKEKLKLFVEKAGEKIKSEIKEDFNKKVRERSGSPLVSAEITSFAKRETDKEWKQENIEITRDPVNNKFTLSATGVVPGRLWGTNNHTEKVTIDVDEVVNQLNNEAIKNVKERETKKVKTEIEALKKAIETEFKKGLAGRNSVEYTNAELSKVIENLGNEVARAYEEAAKDTDVSFTGSVSEDKKLVTVGSKIDGTVQESINLEDFVNELNTQAREARIKVATDKAATLGKFGGNLEDMVNVWLDGSLPNYINQEVVKIYNEKNSAEVDDISAVPEGDQRRIKLELVKNHNDLLQEMLEDRASSNESNAKHNCSIIEDRIPGTKEKFVTVAAKDKNGTIKTHTETINMENELVKRLEASKLKYEKFSEGATTTATSQADYLLKNLNQIKSLDEIANVKDIRANLATVAKQIVVKHGNFVDAKNITRDGKSANIDKYGDARALNDSGEVVVKKDSPLVLSGKWKYGEGVSSDDLQKILDFYEASLNY
ncbi:MAG: Nif11 family protein [Acutalibacteraceae bacterium]